MELTTEDSSGNQATRFLLRGGADATDIEFYSGPSGAETRSVHIEGENGYVGIGTATPQRPLDVNGFIRSQAVEITGGSDIAEPYDVLATDCVSPVAGMVVSIDAVQLGKMRVSNGAYDRTVAGIISGANGVNPGLTLTQQGSVADGAMPVANVGRVWCLCDADANAPIVAGDLLTTSESVGHAMKVGNADYKPGAEERMEIVSFVGQVPVWVYGQVEIGDYIVASGHNDGTAIAIAIAADNITPEQSAMIVGRSWQASDDSSLKLINTIVGLPEAHNTTAAFARTVNDQVSSLQAENARLKERMSRLESLLAKLVRN